MNRVHDMGGRFGDGPVDGRPEHAVFHEDWQARALALTLAAGALGKWNIDMSRHARECLSPKDYTAFGYYEKWIGGLVALLVEQGVVSRAELSGIEPAQFSELATRKLTADTVGDMLARGSPADRPCDSSPLFVVGETVRTRQFAENTFVSGGHTRLPTYAAGAQGKILRYQGTHVLPDSSAHGRGEAAEPLYAVAFAASALWRHPENPDDEVVLDLWQSYLVAA